jgi:cytoskeleton protein RodZ
VALGSLVLGSAVLGSAFLNSTGFGSNSAGSAGRRASSIGRGRGSGGRCDVHLGRFCWWYDEYTPSLPPEPESIVRRRDELVALFDTLSQRLPGEVFVRGFLRNYAKLLHLDPEPLLAAASLSVAPATVHATAEAYVPVSAASPERRRKFIAWGAFVVLAVLVVFLLAANVSKNRPNAQGPETAQPTPAETPSTLAATPQHADSPPAVSSKSPALPAAAEPTAKISPAPVTAAQSPEPKSIAASQPTPSTTPAGTTSLATAPGGAQPTVPDPEAANAAVTPRPQSPVSGSGVSQIHMIFEGESWVEVKDGSGTTIYSRLNTPGTERVVRGTPPLTVVVGNAHGVKLMYQDRVVDLEPPAIGAP